MDQISHILRLMFIRNGKFRKVIGVSFVFGIVMVFQLASCSDENSTTVDISAPKHILWAWERPENLNWLKGNRDVGVAFLAQTISLKNGMTETRSRRQRLDVPPDTYLMAVTRIETERGHDGEKVLTRDQQAIIVRQIIRSGALKRVASVQIDFDATVSERGFYRDLLLQLRKELPPEKPISITALASWCASDRWLGDIPVNEVVPMIFDMGTDDKVIRQFLGDGNDWNEPLCRKAYGIATYQPIETKFSSTRRIYHFNNRPWRESDLKTVLGDI